MMVLPEHIKCHNAPNIKLTGVPNWEFKRTYEWIRDGNSAIKDGCPRQWSCYSNCDIRGMYRFGMAGHTVWENGGHDSPYVEIRFNSSSHGDALGYGFEYEAVLYINTGDAQTPIPTAIHWQVATATLEKGEPDRRGDRDVRITFYDPKDRAVLSIMAHTDIRCREGKYVIDPAFDIVKKKKVDGGCFFCDKAVYQIEGGIVYLACTKYGGRVSEVEYTGEEYPDYCKRRA